MQVIMEQRKEAKIPYFRLLGARSYSGFGFVAATLNKASLYLWCLSVNILS